MSDDRDLDGLSPAEEELARRLQADADLLRALEEGERDLDPSFARTLRAHLVHGDELAPHPTFARQLRAHLLRRRGARPLLPPRRRRWPAWFGVLAVVLTAVILTALRLLPHHTTFPAPYPSRVDLLFNLSTTAATGSSRLGPTASLIRPVTVAPYAGKTRLHAAHLSRQALSVRAYQLASPHGVAARARVLLGIRSPIQRTKLGSVLWLTAADRDRLTHGRLHSLALSLTTGELIYHDRRNFRLPYSGHALSRFAAVQVARHWLTMLGWPGQAMPLKAAGRVTGFPKVRQIVLGWAHAGNALIDDATLWVAPDRSVIEAWVWPPVVRTGGVPSRSIADAWTDIVAHKAPVVIERLPHAVHGIAIGTLQQVAPVLVLVPGSQGTAYLVPAYRFTGTVRVGSASIRRSWLSLVPAAQQ